MSITAYVGLPGAGKTLTCVEHAIIPALKQGRHVVTNVSMKWSAVAAKKFPGTLDELPTDVVLAEPARIFEYALPGCVLVLDEVWRMFPAGVKASRVPEEFRKLLAEHRHMKDDLGRTMQVVFITQDLAQIGAFARQLVETTFRTVKLASLGLSSNYRVDVYNGAVTGQSPPESKRQRQIMGRYNKAVFALYDSHTQAQGGGGDAVDEKAVDRRFVIWRSPVWYLGAPAVLVLAAVCVWRTWAFFHAPPPIRAASVASQAVRASGVGSVQAATRGAKPTPAVPAYRVVGYVGDVRGQGHAAIRANDIIVYMAGADCWRPGDGLTHCSFDGYEVTELGAKPREKIAAR